MLNWAINITNNKRKTHKIVKQTQNNSLAVADKLFDCVCPFCGDGA